MAIGKTPVNQLNALPLQDADTNAAGGSLQIIGGAIVRYFDGTALGINGATAATVNTKVCLVTNYLDLRGCSKYMFALRRTTPSGIVAALPVASLQIQMRLSASDTPSAGYVNGGLNDVMNSIVSVSSATQTFPATLGAADAETALWAWDSGVSTGVGVGLGTMIGSDCRLIVTWSTNPVAATNLFSATLWASS